MPLPKFASAYAQIIQNAFITVYETRKPSFLQFETPTECRSAHVTLSMARATFLRAKDTPPNLREAASATMVSSLSADQLSFSIVLVDSHTSLGKALTKALEKAVSNG